MAENTPEATIIESTATDGGAASSRTLNLPLIVGIIALILSIVALVLVLRGTTAADLSAERDAIAGLETRLNALEAAPTASPEAAGNDLTTVTSEIATLRADLAATIDAVNAELAQVKAGMNNLGTAAAAETTGEDSAAAGALAALSAQLAGLSETVDGSLDQIAALSERLDTADGALQAVKSASAAQVEGVRTALDDGLAALSALAERTDAAIGETRVTLSEQVDAAASTFGEQLTGVQVTLDEQLTALTTNLDDVRAATSEQFNALGDAITGLNDEFTAMKEVSVETSTKVLAVNQLRDALASSAPVRPHMTSLEALNPTEEPLLAALATVDPIADLRVPTQKILAETIRDLSPKLVNETRINAAEGRGGKVLARLGSLVTVEKVDDIAAIPGIEGNMARAAARIVEGDFSAALTELEDDTVEMNLNPDTQARFDALLVDLANRATYEDQRRVLGDWVTTTLNAARATASN